MPQGNCYLSIILAYFSYHTHTRTHTAAPAAIVVWVCMWSVCPLGLLSPMSSSLRILCNQQTFGHRIPQTGIQHTQLSANFPSLSLPLSPISPAFPPASVSVLALILVSAACCYCCSFPPHSLGSLNGQAAAAVAIPLPSLLPCRLRALNRIKNILCIWYVRWRIKCFYSGWQGMK